MNDELPEAIGAAFVDSLLVIILVGFLAWGRGRGYP